MGARREQKIHRCLRHEGESRVGNTIDARARSFIHGSPAIGRRGPETERTEQQSRMSHDREGLDGDAFSCQLLDSRLPPDPHVAAFDYTPVKCYGGGINLALEPPLWVILHWTPALRATRPWDLGRGAGKSPPVRERTSPYASSPRFRAKSWKSPGCSPSRKHISTLPSHGSTGISSNGIPVRTRT